MRKRSEISRKSLYEAIFTIGGRVVSVFIVIAATKFLTTFLSESAYGRLALYNITATLPSTFFFGPLGQGILRFFPIAREKNELGDFHSQYQALFGWGTKLTLSVGLLCAIGCWFLKENEWAVACVLIALLNAVNSLNAYYYGLQNAARKRRLALGLEIGDRISQQGLAVALLWFVSGNPLMVMVGYLASACVFFFFNRFFYRKTFPDTTLNISHTEERSGNYSRDILRYSWPFFLFGGFAWAQNASERWALELLRSTELVAQYAVLNQIGFQSLSLVVGSVGYFLFPILFNRAGSLQNSGQFESANRVNNWNLWFNGLLALALFGVLWLFGEEVVRLLSDEKYVKAAGLLPLMVVAGGLFNFGQNYANRFMLSMQTRLLIFPKIGSAVLGVALSVFSVRFFGLEGLVVALVVTQAVYVFLLMAIWRWVAKRHFTGFLQK